MFLFYSNTERAFRSTLIGHLFEIAQQHPVILLAESFGNDLLSVLNNKRLFPHLKMIIPVQQHAGNNYHVIVRHHHIKRFAKQIYNKYKIDIVISSSDWHSIFEMYLFRFAKIHSIPRITFQDTFNTGNMQDVSKYMLYQGLIKRTPTWLPISVRKYIIIVRKTVLHNLIYYILPMLSGEKPFRGKASFILYRGHSGSRDSNCHVVWSERDRRLLIESGVLKSKILVRPHPIYGDAKYIFKLIGKSKHYNKPLVGGKGMVVVFLSSIDEGVRREDYGLINRDERINIRYDILGLIQSELIGWNVIIKPHPLIKEYSLLKRNVESISKLIKVASPFEPAEKYFETCDVIIDLPRAASTVLYSATLHTPNKPIIAIDFHDELLGDCYKDFPGIEYINNRADLCKLLNSIYEGYYSKINVSSLMNKKREPYLGTINTIEHILANY
jgi:hypothetical protein